MEYVREYVYLGSVLVPSSTFTEATNKLYQKALKAMHRLSRLLDQDVQNVQTMLYAFDHTIKPILLYGAEVWGPMTASKLSKEFDLETRYDNQKCSILELKFMKILLHVKRNTANLAVRGELGRHPLTMYAIMAGIKYYYKILGKNEHSLVKEAMKENIKIHHQGINTWYSKLTEIMKQLKIPFPQASSINMTCIAQTKLIKGT